MTTSKQQNEDQVPPERIKRFTHTYEDGIWNMDERPDGKWVRYSDHERVVRSFATAGAVSIPDAEEDRWREHLKTCKAAVNEVLYAQATFDSISVVEKMRDEYHQRAHAYPVNSRSFDEFNARAIALNEAVTSLRSLSPSVGVGIEGAACPWTLDDSNDGDFWETGCGAAFRFTDEGPAENGFKFCYKCGKPINAGRYSDSATAHDETVSEGDAHE